MFLFCGSWKLHASMNGSTLFRFFQHLLQLVMWSSSCRIFLSCWRHFELRWEPTIFRPVAEKGLIWTNVTPLRQERRTLSLPSSQLTLLSPIGITHLHRQLERDSIPALYSNYHLSLVFKQSKHLNHVVRTTTIPSGQTNRPLPESICTFSHQQHTSNHWEISTKEAI